MVQIRGPTDVPKVQISSQFRGVEISEGAATAVTRARGQVFDRVQEIVNRARDQQIENEVRSDGIELRRRLDELRNEIETDKNVSTEDMPAVWRQRATIIENEITGRRRGAPAYQRLWTQHGQTMLAEEEGRVLERQQQLVIEGVQATAIEAIGNAERIAMDPNTPASTRAEMWTHIEDIVTSNTRARVFSPAEGARIAEAARNRRVEFERTEGLRARTQATTDALWTEAGGDYATFMELARERLVNDPELRDAVEDRGAQLQGRMETAEQETFEDAMEAAYSIIENGGSLDTDLTPAQRDIIERRGQMNGLRSYLRERANPAGIEASNRASATTMHSLLSLNGFAYNNATGEMVDTATFFSTLPLDGNLGERNAARLAQYGIILDPDRSIRTQLNAEDYRAVARAQQVARGVAGSGEDGDTMPTLQARRAISTANAQNFTPREASGNSRRAAVVRRRFEADLARRASQLARERNRPLTDAEINQVIRDSLHAVGRTELDERPDRRIINARPATEARASDPIPEAEARRIIENFSPEELEYFRAHPADRERMLRERR